MRLETMLFSNVHWPTLAPAHIWQYSVTFPPDRLLLAFLLDHSFHYRIATKRGCNVVYAEPRKFALM
jgi:hypothetical protein